MVLVESELKFGVLSFGALATDLRAPPHQSRESKQVQDMTLRNTLLFSIIFLTGGAALAFAQDPKEIPDRGWISLSGEVTATHPEQFTLAYGEDDSTITVEMDDWDWYDEASQVGAGEKVTVYGRIDDGLYEARTIEADSVYVADRNTFFYASDIDEEGDYFAYPHFMYGYYATAPDGTWMTVSGKVTEVDGREFTLDNGYRHVQIDTDEMAYNPMDDEGFQKIRKGHRVSVSGELDVGFFEDDELKAVSIVTLSRDKTKKRSKSDSSMG